MLGFSDRFHILAEYQYHESLLGGS
jgi:hypothetical protein